MASRSSDAVYSVQEAGGRLFYEKLSSDKNVPVLMVREGGKDRLLLDPMAGTDGKTPRTIFSYSVAGKGVPLGLANDTLPAARARTVVEETAISADGTKVPLTIVYSGARAGPAPTVIDAYGSYGVSGTPFYSTS